MSSGTQHISAICVFLYGSRCLGGRDEGRDRFMRREGHIPKLLRVKRKNFDRRNPVETDLLVTHHLNTRILTNPSLTFHQNPTKCLIGTLMTRVNYK